MEPLGTTREELIEEISRQRRKIASLEKSALENKLLTDALRDERKLYVDLANALPSGVYRLRVFSTIGIIEEKWHSTHDEPCVFEFLNDRFCEMFELEKSDFNCNPGIINNFIVEEDRAEFARKNVEANLKVIPFKWDGRLLINGEVLWMHFESLPRILENNDIIWTGFFYDISKLKRAEQEIHGKIQELKKINLQKDRILSIISHDLKTPFNSIIGFSELLSGIIHDGDLGQMEKYADIIHRSSLKAMDLLTNLIEWSMSQNGKKDFKPETLELVDTLKEVVFLFSDIVEKKSLTITQETPLELLAFADKSMMETVLRNLISNAIKFSKPGGIIGISAKKKQGEITIKVSDNGVGMSKSSLEKLFHLSLNPSTPGTLNETGTGLGLILCKDFIDAHGGNIWIESAVGKGSLVTFAIPWRQ